MKNPTDFNNTDNENSENVEYYGIGAFSKVTGIPITTLRYYDEKGILMPQMRNESSNYRYYSAEQIMDAFCIQQLKHLGVPLPEIQAEINNRQVNVLHDYLEERMRQCQSELQRLNAQYATVSKIFEFLELGLDLLQQRGGDVNSADEVEICYVPQTFTVGKNFTAENFSTDSYVSGLSNIYGLLESEKLELNGALHLQFIGHDPTRFQTGDYTARHFFPIKETVSQHQHIGTFGGFWSAGTVYIGLFDYVETAYQKLEAYIAEHNLHIIGDPFEEYPLNHLYLKDPQLYITRVSYPIAQPFPESVK